MATNENKLTTLGQLKTSLQSAKTYIDNQDASLSAKIQEIVSTIDGIVATGGEANILNGVKVNGSALAITDKMVDILIEAGAENGTLSVNGAAIAITGLKELAYKSNISESDLDEALKASIAAKATNADLSALTVRVTDAEGKITEIQGDVESLKNAGYQTAEQVETIAKAAVAASGHAHFEKADAVPTAENAQENVMYLVMNATTGHYDIYALVSGSVERIDDTTVDLSNYSTTEQMQAAITAAIDALSIGDYAKLADLNAALDRITAVEEKFANYYTKEEAEAKFTDETEAQTIAESAAEAAVAAATASDEEVSAALDGIFGTGE